MSLSRFFLIALCLLLMGGVTAAASESRLLLADGSMENGDTVPTGWTNVWPKDAIRVVRDTEVKHSGQASLRIELLKGNGGNVSAKLGRPGGREVEISGWIKTKGAKMVKIQAWTTHWNQGFYRADPAPQEWTRFTWRGKINNDVALQFELAGAGAVVWLDDVEVRVLPFPTTKAERTKRSPVVTAVRPVTATMLAVEVLEKQVVEPTLVPYVAQPGDSIDRSKDGHGVVRRRSLTRNGGFAGLIAGPDENWLSTERRIVGDNLVMGLATDPRQFRLSSTTDAAYRTAQSATTVAFKSKPTAIGSMARRDAQVRHVFYVEFSKPLSADATYTLDLGDINVTEPQQAYVYKPREQRSEAVHASHLGHRPSDPSKVAFLSLWRGTGGATAFELPRQFHLIDDAGTTVFTGEVSLALAEKAEERLWTGGNFSKTNVYSLDYSTFSTPGTYRVFVDGIGCSHPFPIDDDAWGAAFRTAMAGFLHHRRNIPLGPPLTTYVRPAANDPNARTPAYQTSARFSETGNGGNLHGDDQSNFHLLHRRKTDEILTIDLSGGYMDAGDFDPHIGHVWASHRHMELYELFPERIGAARLALPPRTDGRTMPAILDEVLANLDFYRRLQLPDGGVRGGMEYAEHPVSGEPSWLNSLDYFVYAPDFKASFLYAGAAARFASLIERHDAELHRVFRASAIAAMAWGEQDYADWQERWPREKKRQPKDTELASFRDMRNFAALFLYRLTGEQAYHDIFVQQTVLASDRPRLFDWGKADQRQAAFVYAKLLPEKLQDPVLASRARAAITSDASVLVSYVGNNSFRLGADQPYQPPWNGFFTSPNSETLCRAHALTGEQRFLTAAVAAALYSAGANPMNMTFTTGLGHDHPRRPLHWDSMYGNQAPPPGITVAGHFSLTHNVTENNPYFMGPLRGWLSHHLNPSAWDWPLHENYIDVHDWVAQNEYSVAQMAPASYVWGYLHGRP